MPRDADKAIALRSKCKDFRILVIGRANAGKTTLLKKVCNSVEDPEIFGPSGRKISLSNVEGSAERGVHNIGNQLRFKSNRQFVFHDSRGFESGSEDELNKVTAFIAERAASKHLSDQLHAIWYCVPTDTNRPLLATDEQFFNTNITGKVPVIAIFTKFDGLLNEAFSQLMDEGDDWEDAQEGQIEQARKMLTTNFEGPLRSSEFPPADYVRLDDMRVETSNCNELIEKTANALTDNTLRLLFISVQQNNIDFCIRYAMTKGLFRETKVKALLTSTLAHFPHVWREEEYEREHEAASAHYNDYRYGTKYKLHLLETFDRNIDVCLNALKTKYRRPFQFQFVLREQLDRYKLVAAICICAEETFTEGEAKRNAFSPAFLAALNAYYGSTLQRDVNIKIAKLFEQYAEATVDKMAELIQSHRLRIHSPAGYPPQCEETEPRRKGRRSLSLARFVTI